MSDSIFFFLLFLLLLAIEGVFNTLAGLWSVFWVPVELVFDVLFFLAMMALAFVSIGNKKEVKT